MGEEAEHNTHQFKKDAQFDHVLELYIFDRELRLLVMDAIERIDVSIRTILAYQLGHKYGPHPQLNQALFKASWNYAFNYNKLKREVRYSKETFIKHLRERYAEPMPPIWAVVVIFTLGQLSKWYANLKHGADRNLVSGQYDLDEINLVSFLHHLSTVRNLCAHHSRLWNREFTFTFKLPRRRPAILVNQFNSTQPRKVYNTLVMLLYLMDIISPQHHWRKRLLSLINDNKNETRAMGFLEPGSPCTFGRMGICDSVIL